MKKTIFLSTLVLIAYIWITIWAIKEFNNPCIMNTKETIVGGNIYSYLCSPRYYLHYGGTKKLTGEECQIRICVAKEKYEKEIGNWSN